MKFKTFNYIKVLLLVNLSITSISLHAQNQLKLWYNQPARMWEESLPLGNGRLGMTPNGDAINETIVLNDITLWSGSPQDANNYEAYKSLPEIRQLILEGKNDEAQRLVDAKFVCKGEGSAGARWGKFQTLSSLHIQHSYSNNSKIDVKNYKRVLDLNEAVASSMYTVEGVNYKKEYFCSFDDDVNVIRLTADRNKTINIQLSLTRPERFSVKTSGKDLIMSGQLDNGIDGKGMLYESRVRVRLKDGSLTTTDTSLIVNNASEVLIFVAAGTDFREKNYKQDILDVLAEAIKKPYAHQKKNHIKNFRKLFGRVDVNLGNGKEEEWDTQKRLDNYYNGYKDDVSLAPLFFQFGRYLSISSTRVGLLPPNLQGLWAKEINTPWNSDYHLDVNVQMNHWPLGVSNLSELNLPLVDLVKGLVEPGQKTAKAYYNARGWIAHVVTNVWGFTEPGESASWGASNAGSGWLCNNLWEHYDFTQDENYLKEIYPILKGSALFYNDALVKDPKTGWMVTSPSVSPENSFYLPNGNVANISMGPTIDNQIVRELFTNVITASKLLNIDPDFRAVLEEKLKFIPPPGIISKSGRIQEWLEDYKETELEHRHISHLYGLYPASLITVTKTPDLAEASKRTLEVRGDDGVGWAIAYKQLFWARLHDGNRAFKLLKEMLKPTMRTDINYGAGGGVYYNLLAAGPPFQIDGNFGATAGIGEMLLQSHDGFIDLLPAIPDAWKSYGDVKGLKAKGNITVDMKWVDGKIIAYNLRSPSAKTVKVKVNGEMKEIKTKKI